MMLNHADLRDFLDEKVDQYNRANFIESDPICIPHQFDRKEDIEIAGFLVATIAWGQRTTIISNGKRLMRLMDESPYDFVLHAGEQELKRLDSFCHRTFNGIDTRFFVLALRELNANHGGLEKAFLPGDDGSAKSAIINFGQRFFSTTHPERTRKHVSNPAKNSSAKRLNMYLRWMVRKDKRGVDFGLWNSLSPAQLQCPLDVHSGSVARKLGLLTRKANDWKAVEELGRALRSMDAEDPVKYDFALFGLGVFEKF